MASQPTGWVGWVYFAGMLMLVRGVFDIFLGILALVHNTVFLVTNNGLAAFNFTAWGWIDIVLGAVLIAAAGAVFSGRMWGRLVGALMVALALVANLAFLPAYPIWSILAIIIDVLILYSLLVHGDEVKA